MSYPNNHHLRFSYLFIPFRICTNCFLYAILAQDVTAALLVGNTFDGDRKLLYFVGATCASEFNAAISGAHGSEQKHVEEFHERQRFFKMCLVMKWRMGLQKSLAMPHFKEARVNLVAGFPGDHLCPLPFKVAPEHATLFLEAGNTMERDLVDESFLALLYVEAVKVWDSDRFDKDDDSLLLTDALLVPSLAEAIRCTVVFWSRLAAWRPSFNNEQRIALVFFEFSAYDRVGSVVSQW